MKEADAAPDGAVMESHALHVGADVQMSRVKFWVALGLVPFDAVIVTGYAPEVPIPGIPERVAVLPPLLTKVTPEGRAPTSVKVIGAVPVAVTVKVPVVPTPKFAVLALEIPGGVAAEATPTSTKLRRLATTANTAPPAPIRRPTPTRDVVLPVKEKGRCDQAHQETPLTLGIETVGGVVSIPISVDVDDGPLVTDEEFVAVAIRL